MDLNFTRKNWRSATRCARSCASHVPEAIAQQDRRPGAHAPTTSRAWQSALHKRGWGAPGWPKQFGGTGWIAVQRYIFDEECAAAGAPRTLPFGLKMVAPVIMAFGTPTQQQRFLPRHPQRRGLVVPGLLGARRRLRPRLAEDARRARTGDHYIVNGQKTWTTLGQYADWIFCLVRTDPNAPKQQQGITFLLIDMKTPGHHRAADHHAGRRARGQRGVVRERARAGREPASAKRTRAGPTPSSCSATSAPTSPASARRSASSTRLKHIARQRDEERPAAARGPAVRRARSRRSRST